MIKFYDTSSLLEEENIDDNVYYSSITLQELENIKNPYNNYSEELKYKARQVLNKIDSTHCCLFKASMLQPILNKGYEINNDLRILACALETQSWIKEPIVFYTNDKLLQIIANTFLPKEQIKSIVPKIDTYTGFKEITFSEKDWEDFYYHLQDNTYAKLLNLLPNEYLSVQNSEEIELYCWTGNEFRSAWAPTFASVQLGNIKPMKDDIYQLMAADSLVNNKITMIKGPAGSGKTTLALGYLFYMLEKGKISRIIIFCNTVATKNSAKLGLIEG